MKPNYKKSLKFITLLISAILIATVSATTYKYMYLEGTVNIGTQELAWIKTGTGEISGDTVTQTLTVTPDFQEEINDTLYLWNKDTAAHNMTIKVITAAAASKFDVFQIHIYSNESGSWVYRDYLNATTLNDVYSTYTINDALNAGYGYKFNYVIKATLGATGSTTFKLEVKYED
jgi:hypothetical protein